MNKTKTLETVRDLTPDVVLSSPAGRLKIALLQLVARLLPGRFAVWLSLLDAWCATGRRWRPGGSALTTMPPSCGCCISGRDFAPRRCCAIL